MESERGRKAEWAEAIREGCLEEEETELDTKSVRNMCKDMGGK